ncbi:MAG: peptide chain release factor N(5)-glutamine methyltransferase [Chloroflexota bacterium]
MSPVASGPRSVDAALAWGRSALGHLPASALDTRLLLEHVTGLSTSAQVAHGDRELSASEWRAFEQLLRRRMTGEPVAYLRGHIEWYGRDFLIDSTVLVPRPETEHVLAAAIDARDRLDARMVVDVGTGSGVIATQMALAAPGAQIVATDISADALRVARLNVSRAGVADRVMLVQGHLLEPVPTRPDLVVANLPYLSRAMMEDLAPDVRLEPRHALFGGETGLELYGDLLDQLDNRGWDVPVIAEIDPRQEQAALSLFRSALPTMTTSILPDYAGHARVVVAVPA